MLPEFIPDESDEYGAESNYGADVENDEYGAESDYGADPENDEYGAQSDEGEYLVDEYDFFGDL